MNVSKLIFLISMLLLCNGCVLTKALTVPMRLTGAVISVIPIAGDTAHNVIDGGAETVDKLPF
jgi:hypothetical protein